MKNLKASQFVSFSGLVAIWALALHSPHTRSSMSQASRDTVHKKEAMIRELEDHSTPLSYKTWSCIEPAATATRDLIESESHE